MKNFTIKATQVLVASALIAGLWASTAHAGFVLKIDDNNGHVVTVTDEGVGDLAAGTIGQILSNLNNWNGFSILTNTGISKPQGANSPTTAFMDLNSISVATGNVGGHLTLSLTDTDFQIIGDPGSMVVSIGGTLGSNAANSLQSSYYVDTTNTQFGTVGASTIASGVYNGPGGFSGNYSLSGVVGTSAPFSMTQVIDINLAANEAISFDSDFRVVPEPSMLALLGLGLLGFAGARRFNKK